MSESQATTTMPSQKRPLEDPSSPAHGDLPDAKRQALDKVTKPDTASTPTLPEPITSVTKTEASKTDGDAHDYAVQTHPIATHTTETNGKSNPASQDESKWLHLRAIISSQEAATIIGKGGENVTKIRQISGAKCTISEYTRGAVERILTVNGPADAVAKVCYSPNLCL
jgi:heterogeneous nuclear rnp K-like protein